MFVIAGIAGGLSLAIFLDVNTIQTVKPFLVMMYLLGFFLIYLLFEKSKKWNQENTLKILLKVLINTISTIKFLKYFK